MIQPLRKFSVYLAEEIMACYPEQLSFRPYPVLAMTTNDEGEGEGEDLVLLANNKAKFTWISLDECTLASIDD